MRTDPDHDAYMNAPIGIVMAERRTITACNPAFAAMFGYRREALVGQSLAILYPSREEFLRTGEIGLGPLRRTGAYGDERIMARADGSLFWCRVSG
ncbi:MAG: PAS domain S-box protein, partial [Rhizobiaceae bacterium]